MENYYIFSLPRSMTTWLSNLLTTDDCVCFHDAISVWGIQFKVSKQYKKVGFCETNPLIYKRVRIENSKVITIRSDEKEVYKKCLNAWPTIFDNDSARMGLFDSIQKWSSCLDEIEERENCYSVNVNELSNIDEISKIFGHLDIKFDLLRTKLLMGYRINQMYCDRESFLSFKDSFNKLLLEAME